MRRVRTSFDADSPQVTTGTAPADEGDPLGAPAPRTGGWDWNGRLRNVTPLEAVAGVLMLVGLAAIALAWYHTGNTDQVWIQAQEIASGGLGGIALIIVGVGLMIRAQLARNAVILARRLDRLDAQADNAGPESESAENVVPLREARR